MLELQRQYWKQLHEFTQQTLPEALLVHMWLNIQLDDNLSLSERLRDETCYVDKFPNPTILCCTSSVKDVRNLDNYTTACLWCGDTENLAPFLKEVENKLSENYSHTKDTVNGILYCGVHHNYSLIIQDYYEKNSPDTQVELFPEHQYWIPWEKQKLLLNMENIQAPGGFYFDKLKIEEAEFVDDKWPHKYQGSLATMEYRIKHLPNVALRQIGTGELACFEMINDEHGYMNHLFTVEQFRRQGLATKVELALARLLIGETNFVPFKIVVKENHGGIAMTVVNPWWQELDQLACFVYCVTKKAIC